MENPSRAGAAVSKALAAKATKSTSTTNQFILDRKDIPSDRNAYVYRDAKTLTARKDDVSAADQAAMANVAG